MISSVATADEGGQSTASSDATTGQVAAQAGLDRVGGQQASGSAPSRPRCSWQVVTLNQLPVGYTTSTDPVRRDEATTSLLPPGSAAGQGTQTLYLRSCPGQSDAWVWASDGVDEDDLIASAFQRVTAQVPSPAMNMNPDPSVGGIVNIGLWLAVEDPGQVSITASVGPVWATVTARYEHTTWDMGNGDSVECAGLGTPIVDWDTPEQGPCGYTYRWPSAPKFTGTDDLAYHASVTGHWDVTYATSSGRSGTLSPIARTTDFAYQVREIQTLRVAEDG